MGNTECQEWFAEGKRNLQESGEPGRGRFTTPCTQALLVTKQLESVQCDENLASKPLMAGYL